MCSVLPISPPAAFYTKVPQDRGDDLWGTGLLLEILLLFDFIGHVYASCISLYSDCLNVIAKFLPLLITPLLAC